MSPDEIRRELPDLPRLVDAWQAGSLDAASQAKLTDLLRSRRDARQYFLEQCQIDAELRWRFASQSQIAGTLARRDEGSPRPIAAIVLSGLGFREDPGFPAVFDKIEASEYLAHQWLHIYVTLRACLFLCFPRPADAEATVQAICEELASRPLANLSPEQFTQLACEVTCHAAGRQFRGRAGGVARKFTSILRRCLKISEECDVVAIYEALEASVPRQVPADRLRLLGMRYLLEQSPQQIALSLQLPEPTIRNGLAQARLEIWKLSAPEVGVSEMPAKLQALPAFLSALDRPELMARGITIEGRHASSERLWRDLDAWTASRVENCRAFLTFAILHEALFRRLSLNHLLEVSKTRKDEEFHRVVTDMVLHLEETSLQGRPVTTTRRAAKSYAPVGWVAATAAALLIAASTALWWGGDAPEIPQSAPLVADQGSPVADPVVPPPVPARIMVATVKAALEVQGPGDESFGAGAPVYAHEPIELAAGILHLTVPSGSEWVLEGPVSAVLNEWGEISLSRGKLVGLNKGEGEPLVVQTPAARVLDKGTEFGVSVGDDQKTSVAVYDGAVELRSAPDANVAGASRVLRIEANFEAAIERGGSLPAAPTESLHDRAFIRPDEVALREEQQQGSDDAAKSVAFFKLLRVEGLLAYQGFDGPSQGEKFVVGFQPPRTEAALEFGDDLEPRPEVGASSNSLLLSNGSTVFLDLDVSRRAPLARAGVVGSSGLVGGSESEMWLCWRSKSLLPADRRFHWTGLSLMHGDARQAEEPVFIGQTVETAHFGVQIFNGPEEVIQPLDTDAGVPEAQTISSDDLPHLWVARITTKADGSGFVAVWCDVDPAQIEATPPHAEQPVDDLKFDRIRLEVSPEGDTGHCAYDEVFLTTSLQALAEAMARRHPPATP